MKKYLIMAAMLLTMNVSTFASDAETEVNKVEMVKVNGTMTKNYDMCFNHRRLACVLDMTTDQMEAAESVFDSFDTNMKFASTIESEERSYKIVSNAVKENLRWMKYILKDDQYKKYRLLLNLTLMNKGFNMTMIQ